MRDLPVQREGVLKPALAALPWSASYSLADARLLDGVFRQ